MSGAVHLRAGDRLLITRLNYLGDVVLSLPLVDAIHAAVPGVEIDYLARRPGSDLIAGDPRFAMVHTLESGAGASIRLVRALRARRYRAVIDLYSNPRSAWLTFMSGARVRVGGRRRGRRHLYTHPVSVPGSVRRVTDVFLRYAEPFGVSGPAGKPTLPLSVDERARAGARAGASEWEHPVIGVHPGGKWPVKRWPARHFASLVERLRAEFGADVIVFTGPGEEDATEAVRDAVGDGARYAPAMGVRELASVISGLDAMVACDGGVMHVSVAVGTPTVGIFGSSEPDVWFPYEKEGAYRAAFVALPCRPCHRHVCPLGHTNCLNELTVEAVADLVGVVLKNRAAGMWP